MIEALTEPARARALAELPHWTYDGERRALYRKFLLADFTEAMGLMTRIALHAEKADHHPEWFNVYNRLEIWLTTHDAGGVSDRDLHMARLIDGIAPG